MANVATAAKRAVDTYAGLNPAFRSKLQALVNASGGKIYIVSGYRSPQRQAQLFAAAVKKYGSEKAARRWVAPPGKSNHNHGIAADLGGDLALAHKLAPQFGLWFPMSHEKWHIEPTDARSNPDAYTTPPDGTTPVVNGGTDLHKIETQIANLAQMVGSPDTSMFESAGQPEAASGTSPVGTGVGGIVAAARAAGFKGQSLVTAIAVALAESGGRSGARNVNKDASKSVDRGPWQINSKWHPEVTDEEADDPMSAATHAFRISGGGTNWKPWTTYKTGAYKKYLVQAQEMVGNG